METFGNIFIIWFCLLIYTFGFLVIKSSSSIKKYKTLIGIFWPIIIGIFIIFMPVTMIYLAFKK